jgi:beta-lactamase regulating signal transducer with metallopeptidase domain/HEAT repeat protein
MTPISLVAWTLLHFIWQGALLAGALAVILFAGHALSARVRYGISVVAFAIAAALPVVTAFRLAGSMDRPGASAVGTSGSPESASAPLGAAVQADVIAPAPGVVNEQSAAHPATADMRTAATAFASAAARVLENWGNRAAPFLVVVWLTGVLVLSTRLLGGWVRVRRLTTDGTREASQAARQLLAELAARLGVKRAVRLLESARMQVPAVVGWLRPVIIMPLSLQTGLPQHELELLLAHELAHVRRHDYFINLLQTVVETTLFYHPAIWWMSRQIREERENCCDDIAVALTNDRRAYADALLNLERLRQPVPALAAAATGGNLLRRIRRLLVAPAPHVASRPRWAAIPIGVTALTAIMGGMGLGGQPLPAALVFPTAQEELESTDSGKAEIQQGRARNARPDTVIRYEGNATSLGEKWSWAAANARRDGRSQFWIGYSITGNPSRGWVYIDRHVPVISGSGTFSGRFRFQGNPSSLTFTGARLDSLIGPRDPEELVVLYGFSSVSGRVELDRVHLGNALLPVHFVGRSFYWLGEADDEASIAVAQRLFSEVRGRDLRHDLVSIVGSHIDARVVLPALRQWLASDEPDELRAEVAEELGAVPSVGAIALMARTARSDRSSQVRQEAAEAFGEHELPEAADTLVRLVADLRDQEARREAIEALGEREEGIAFDALVRLAWDDPSTELQREAVETIGESRNAGRVRELERILRDHPRGGARQEAAETLGELEDPAAARRPLRDAVDRDSDSDVRQQAVQTLGELGDREAMEMVSSIARTHRDVDVRQAALEALAEHGDKAAVFGILEETIMRGTDYRLQVKAVEALADIDDARAVRLLEQTANRHTESAVQKASAEALSSAAPVELAWSALGRLIFAHPSEDVQRAAVEALGSIEHSGAAELLERIAVEHPRVGVRRSAVEELADVETDRARSTLERLARTASDEAVQVAAIESFSNAAPAAEVVRVLAAIARTGESERVQSHALEELGDMDDFAGIPALIEIARSHQNLAIRRKAIEYLGDSEDPRAHAELARLLRAK